MSFFSGYAQRASEYLNVNTASGIMERAKAAVAEAAGNISETMQAEYRRAFQDISGILRVRPELLIIEFPDDDNIDSLANHLNTEHSQKMLIYNMSERIYDTTKFHGEVIDIAFRGLPAPPLELLFELCVSAHCWLTSDSGNVLIVHCFQDCTRSAVFISCFMAFNGMHATPQIAFQDVCKTIGMASTLSIIPSQRRYLEYFHACLQGLSPSRVRSHLVQVEVTGVALSGAHDPRPYIEVWNNRQLVFSSSLQATTSTSSTPTLQIDDSSHSALFRIPEDIVVVEDVLIRIRNEFTSGRRETVCRTAFHTAFVSESLQLKHDELDSTSVDACLPDAFCMNIVVRRMGSDLVGDISPIFAQARGLSDRLRGNRLEATDSASRNVIGLQQPQIDCVETKALESNMAIEQQRSVDHHGATRASGSGQTSLPCSSDGTYLDKVLQRQRARCAEFESIPTDSTADVNSSVTPSTKELVEANAKTGVRKSDADLQGLLATLRDRCKVLESTPAPTSADAGGNPSSED